jgi:hypothetical protein
VIHDILFVKLLQIGIHGFIASCVGFQIAKDPMGSFLLILLFCFRVKITEEVVPPAVLE